MAKKKRKAFESNKTKKTSDDKRRQSRQSQPESTEQSKGFFQDRGVRETIESIIIAIILALLFRAYEAEAFIIPTGSMAPTLMGRHLDLECEKCGQTYLAGASTENPDAQQKALVVATCCPVCRYRPTLSRSTAANRMRTNEDSFAGDRILVSKFAYEIGDPRRWDVIVFKYPENPKQNYIKRLIGLPNETIKIAYGDIYAKASGSNQFEIARKPPHKITAMMQLIDDTDHTAPDLTAAGWPSKWQQWNSSEGLSDNAIWNSEFVSGTSKQKFAIKNDSDNPAWLRYRHLIPRYDWSQGVDEWKDFIDQGEVPPRLESAVGEAIRDHYAYNDTEKSPEVGRDGISHWVGDLAVEAWLNIKSKSGKVGVDLVEGGAHFTCWFNLDDGTASIECSDSNVAFDEIAEGKQPTASKAIRGTGNYRVRFANFDDQLTVWINNRVIKFDCPLTYTRTGRVDPVYSPTDPADAEPAGFAAMGTEMEVSRIKLYRDIYYISQKNFPNLNRQVTEYGSRNQGFINSLNLIMENPTLWNVDKATDPNEPNREVRGGKWLFGLRDVPDDRVFVLEDDQFMPLGDNSPASFDTRNWNQQYVERINVSGKALLVYWPHSWRPFWPNFKRMGFIR